MKECVFQALLPKQNTFPQAILESIPQGILTSEISKQYTFILEPPYHSMINFMCQLGWTKVPRYLGNIKNHSVEVFLNDISI